MRDSNTLRFFSTIDVVDRCTDNKRKLNNEQEGKKSSYRYKIRLTGGDNTTRTGERQQTELRSRKGLVRYNSNGDSKIRQKITRARDKKLSLTTNFLSPAPPPEAKSLSLSTPSKKPYPQPPKTASDRKAVSKTPHLSFASWLCLYLLRRCPNNRWTTLLRHALDRILRRHRRMLRTLWRVSRLEDPVGRLRGICRRGRVCGIDCNGVRD